MESDARSRIWEIRPLLDALHDVREQAIAFLDDRPELDPGARSMWIGDIKSLYNTVYAAWELLYSAAGSEERSGLDASRRFLSEAKARLEMCVSVMRSFEGAEALRLGYALRDAYARCWKAIEVESEALAPPELLISPISAVIAVSQSQYQIPCAVCGKISGLFETGQPRWEQQEMLLYKGITSSHTFDIDLAQQMFQHLALSDLRSVHKLMKKFRAAEDGLDVYCPDCDKAYCRRHYQVREEWDEGFYDCSVGTCPKGHERIIDD